MRILVVGAGAIGGYFGGRLLEFGRDVTFLVRPRRGAELAMKGLVIRSRFGDATLPAPPTVTAAELREPFDLILLSCKAYDLVAAAESFAPAVGANTAILPLLNGMGHLDLLAARFGGGRVLGGLCIISVTLDGEGRILHLNDSHVVSFGERDGRDGSGRVEAIAAEFEGTHCEARRSNNIMQEMWEKWVLIATTAGINCLMRAPIGDIVAAGADNLGLALLDECCAIAAWQGYEVAESARQRIHSLLTGPGSMFAASMLRDIERGAPIEANHIIGDLLRRGEAERVYPLLRIAEAHLNTYQARRIREQSTSQAA